MWLVTPDQSTASPLSIMRNDQMNYKLQDDDCYINNIPYSICEIAEELQMSPKTFINAFCDYLLDHDLQHLGLETQQAIRLIMQHAYPLHRCKTQPHIPTGNVIQYIDSALETRPHDEEEELSFPLTRANARAVRDSIFSYLMEQNFPTWTSRMLSNRCYIQLKMIKNNLKNFRRLQQTTPPEGDWEVCFACKVLSGPGITDIITQGTNATTLPRRFRVERHLRDRQDIVDWLSTLNLTPLAYHGLAAHALLTINKDDFQSYIQDMRALNIIPNGHTACHHSIMSQYKKNVAPYLLNRWNSLKTKLSPVTYLSIDTIFGYNTNTTRDEIIQDIQDWVAGGSLRPSVALSLYRQQQDLLTTFDLQRMEGTIASPASIMKDTSLLFSPGVAGGHKWDFEHDGEITTAAPTKT